MATEADGDEKAAQGEDPSFIEPISFVAWRTPFRIRYCPGLTKIGGSDLNRASPGASGGRLGGLRCCPGLTGVVGCCLGPAEVRRSWFRNGELSGTGVVSTLAWQTVTCHSSTSPRHTGSFIRRTSDPCTPF